MDREEYFEIEIHTYCEYIRNLLLQQDYNECERQILAMMERFPHNPEPHNLLGIVSEKKGDHLLALKHFRVALSLNPSYAPAIHNLETYATLFSHGSYAIDENDCRPPETLKEKSEGTESLDECNAEDEKCLGR